MEIREISKAYSGEAVLDKVSFSIDRGETVVLSGVSGRGKTTLLRLLIGLEKPDSGEILDAPVKISAVFQEDRFPADFTAERCITLALPNKISVDTLSEQMEELGLSEHMKKPVKELSGGQKRRLAICRAVLADADTVYMDEPFTGLDEATRIRTIEYIKKHCAGKTLVIVSHGADDARLLNAREIRI